MLFSAGTLLALTVLAPFASTAPPPFTPEGGIGLNTTPVYAPLSDFDFQSINLALNQEWIELDLFHHGLAQFSDEEFEAAGLDAEDRYLIQFMAEQEVGHATALSNILGPNAAKPCNYSYPFTDVRSFVDFCQKLTRWGESGVYGFLEHLDSRPAANILLQSITTEARQQMAFRQFEGLFPMPEWFIPGITQSMAWTLLSNYIVSCPAENPRIEWQNFPALNIENNPSVNDQNLSPGISSNVTALSSPGQELSLTWDSPGKTTGYDGLYTTNTTAGDPQFVAWISQLNTTYTPLTDINGNSGKTTQPGGNIFGDGTAPLINSTIFIVITDADIFVTPANMSKINEHIVAGPAVYQSG
ncbi:stress response protein [Moniliophthora roreri MCA 2997]|uniref:Stress response protein n=1 Tax=Moniliophthora roreri (strain MCA 2997) TaxID=1381753 RepID=V2X6D1_MONRO|nr:stress response protein [Moniliophthora roreri MCA 2997]